MEKCPEYYGVDTKYCDWFGYVHINYNTVVLGQTDAVYPHNLGSLTRF